jgi:carbonic anhydrase/acetyltransferase-like protein (isoleucine patch superfamily)
MKLHTRFRPDQIHPTVFVATGVVIVGDVTLEADVSIWFNAVLRGDTEALLIGSGTNIQDGAILHADPGYPAQIGRGCTIGHGAMVHGARLGDNVLVGMGAIVLNGVEVGDNCVIGAGALLTQDKTFPPASLILGSPARVMRAVTAAEIENNRRSAAGYIAKAQAYRQGDV